MQLPNATGVNYQSKAQEGYRRLKKLQIELVIGLLLAVVAGVWAANGRARVVERAETMLASGTRTDALIVETRQWRYRGNDRYALVYEFRDRIGKRHVESIDVNEEAYSAVKEGSQVEIIYDPINPEISDRTERYEYQATLPRIDIALVCIATILGFGIGIIIVLALRGRLPKRYSWQRVD
jgi:hypothetical protein